MRRSRALLWFALLPAWGEACLDPTQIEIAVRADRDACAAGGAMHAAVFVGEPRGVEIDLAPTGVFDVPCDGREATLFVASSGKGEEIGVRVVASASGAAQNCDRATAYAGCIVARRRIAFGSHETRRLVVDLHASCVDRDRSCGPYGQGTCVAGGACRNASIDPSRCVSGTCDESALGDGLEGDKDAGVPDASRSAVDALGDDTAIDTAADSLLPDAPFEGG